MQTTRRTRKSLHGPVLDSCGVASRKRSFALVPALAVLALAPAPASSDEESEEPAVSDVFETSAARIPAVTKFPTYPPLARRDRIEGEATVCFKVAPNGRILDETVESSTHKIFEKPALKAIRESSFEPLGPDGKVSATPVCRTYRFRLDPVEQPAEV